eukprot:CAMPEP_0174384250 /NCGR_PEP_ID=MMETSP0811_2-20130205/125794_1 /TAXON_ID=73025 ORGANISM="Eutreptiella gymnastica-like, Strain CCMP1594" /NCGR_SAMPLE_ID=MMETSP0811_2 /ASSEMBLY_ACC=CAM_ASM_000667 /LENGTH=36 /DNA_ID= /DNA_START= /DNA_END= /DNA_ORIENTATION=
MVADANTQAVIPLHRQLATTTLHAVLGGRGEGDRNK